MHVWLQPDNAGYADSMNRYQMERGNPVDILDPTGLAGNGHGGNLPSLATVLKAIQGPYVPDRGYFVAMVQRQGGDNTAGAIIRFYPNNKVKCTQVKLVQIIESYKVMSSAFSGFDQDISKVIDAPPRVTMLPDDNTVPGGKQVIWNGLPGGFAEATDGPDAGHLVSSVSFVAQTYAIAVNGPEAGDSFGYVRWGWDVAYPNNYADVWIYGIGMAVGTPAGHLTENWNAAPLHSTPQAGDLTGQKPVWTPL